MEIRKSTMDDMSKIMSIFDSARAYMIAHGNATQWADGYPGEDVLKNDIDSGCNYVVIEDGMVVATFSFIIGEEPTYQIIENGAWHYDLPYGTIHRLASNGKAKGVARACFDYCFTLIDYIRVDTHKDNLPMQTAFTQYGFQQCGTIYVRNSSERIAYDVSVIKFSEK